MRGELSCSLPTRRPDPKPPSRAFAHLLGENEFQHTRASQIGLQLWFLRVPPATSKTLSTDQLRTVRLLCSDAHLTLEPGASHAKVKESSLRGVAAYLAVASGRRVHGSIAVAPVLTLRRALLGADCEGDPRVLIRVDEFPHAMARDEPDRFGCDQYARFHEVFAAAGVPYLIAVLPQVAHHFLDPDGDDGDELQDDERVMLGRLQQEGVAFGLHGHTHRTRDANPRRHSVMRGMSVEELEGALDRAERALDEIGIRPEVFVPPFNHFDQAHYAVLAHRYKVVCGGPESARQMGLRVAPCWIDGSVYLPSYAPLYGRATQVTAAVEELVTQRAAVWAPVTLHFGWELDDDLSALRTLVERLAPYVRPWSDFLDAVDASR